MFHHHKQLGSLLSRSIIVSAIMAMQTACHHDPAPATDPDPVPDQEKTVQDTNKVSPLYIPEMPQIARIDSIFELSWFKAPASRMNASGLEEYQHDFKTHFKAEYVNANGTTVQIPLANTTKSFPWTKLNSLVGNQSKAIVGVLISYGILEHAFVPILELVYIDGVDLKVLKDAVFIYDDLVGDFKSIAPAAGQPSLRDKMVDDYIAQMRVRRTNATPPVFTALSKANDPSAIFFPWEAKFVELMKDNPPNVVDERYLVLSCISAEAQLIAGGATEFRHGLALHVAKIRKVNGVAVLVDLLDDTDQLNNMGNPNYAYKAMDLGTLCPPNCPKR